MAADDHDLQVPGLAPALFGFSTVVSLVALVGWGLGSLALMGFGIPAYPVSPIVALANALIGVALLLTDRRHGVLRILLIGASVAIALAALIEHTFSSPLGFDRLFFSPPLRSMLPNPGQASLLACGLVLITATAAALLVRKDRYTWPIFLLACLLVGLGATSAALLVLHGDLVQQAARLTTSLPVSLATLGYGAGLLASNHGWGRQLLWRRTPFPLAAALVVLLVLPAVQLPIQMRIEQLGVMTPLAAQTFASMFHLLVVIGVIGWAFHRLSRDNDTLSQVTRAWRESEERLRLAIEAHEIGIFDWDVRSGRLSWSIGAEQRLGLAPGTITSFDTWTQYIEPKELRALRIAVTKATNRQSERFSFHYHLHVPGGSVRAIEGSARCFYDRNGGLVRAIGVDLDVTDRDHREAALRAGQAHLQSILETVPDAMVVTNERGRITMFSAAAERLFGYTAKEAMHRDISSLMPALRGEEGAPAVTRGRKIGLQRAVGRSRILSARKASGELIPVELYVGESWINRKHVFTGFVRDISDRVAAEERMDQLGADYAHVARLNAMGEMAAALAHELNQPLAAAANYLGIAEQTLLRDGGQADAAEAIENANRQLLRTGEIIRRLRDFMAKRDVELHVEDLDSIIADAIALAFVGQVQVRTISEIAPEARMIIVDRIQVQQVLVNVLRNAAQAVRDLPPERRVIRLSAEVADRGLIKMSVQDTGPGFPQRVLANLHAPFVPNKGRGGMGIGLSVSRRIIESHGGTFNAYNAVDGGAVVSFTLPVYREDSEGVA